MTNGDKVNLPLTPQGRELANRVTASCLANGQTVTEAVVEVAGHQLLQLTVHGKRAGEGEIAAGMKARKA